MLLANSKDTADPITGQYYNQPYSEYLKSQASDNRGWFGALSDFSAAVADKLTGGLTQSIRKGLGYDDAVNYNSRAYSNGAVVGEVLGTAIQFIPPCRAIGLARAGLRGLNGAQALGDTISAGKAFSQGEVIGGLGSLASAGASFTNMLRSCFAAGTPLLTPDGSKAIEQFQAGDLVLSRDENDPTAPVMARRVLQVMTSVAPILNLHVGRRIIGTTGEHPFYVKGKGWTVAGELRTGDVLVGHEGWEMPVEGIEDTGRIETVYNLEVEEDHTYFVGAAEWGWDVWSHNDCHHIVSRYLNLSRGWTKAWSVKAQKILEKAGVGIESALNKVTLLIHKGPHPELYHQRVYERLAKAVKGKRGAKYTKAVEDELARIETALQGCASRLSGIGL